MAPAHVAVAIAILLWNIFIAGQMVQHRQAPRPLTGLTGVGALLLVPAAVTFIATSLLETGRAVGSIAWVWPACTILFALQALYATSRRLVHPLLGVPIAVYDILIAVVAVARFMIFRGETPPEPLVALTAAQASSLGVFIGSMALHSPFALQVPILSPAFPARWRASQTVRALLALYAAAWAVLVAVQLPRGYVAVRAYQPYADDLLTERPDSFEVGLKLFPDLEGPPPPVSLRHDVALRDSLAVRVLSLTIEPEGARLVTLDSLARLLEPMRDSTTLVVTLGYPEGAGGKFRAGRERYTVARLAEVDRIVRRLRPDIMLPADEPYGRGARVLGPVGEAYWRDYLTRAANLTHTLRPRTRVGVAASSFDSRDSALYAWVTSPQSPVDLAGFSLYPGFGGARVLRTRMSVADRWMRSAPRPLKPHWVWSAGGYPAVHGESSQANAIWGTLAWATARQDIRGVIIEESGDYWSLTGLRAGDGRLRSSTRAIARALRGLRENRDAASVPASDAPTTAPTGQAP